MNTFKSSPTYNFSDNTTSFPRNDITSISYNQAGSLSPSPYAGNSTSYNDTSQIKVDNISSNEFNLSSDEYGVFTSDSDNYQSTSYLSPSQYSSSLPLSQYNISTGLTPINYTPNALVSYSEYNTSTDNIIPPTTLNKVTNDIDNIPTTTIVNNFNLSEVPSSDSLPMFLYKIDPNSGKKIRYLVTEEDQSYNTDKHYGTYQQWLLFQRQGDHYDNVQEWSTNPISDYAVANNLIGYSTLNEGYFWDTLPPLTVYQELPDDVYYQKLLEYSQTESNDNDN